MHTLSSHFSEEENLMIVTMAGTFGGDDVGELATWSADVSAKVKNYFMKSGKKLNVLADVSALQYTSAAILNEMVTLMKNDDPYIRKTATFGANPAIFAAGEIVLALSGRENVKAFHTEEEARAWLAQD
jgi:hypothetical protein